MSRCKMVEMHWLWLWISTLRSRSTISALVWAILKGEQTLDVTRVAAEEAVSIYKLSYPAYSFWSKITDFGYVGLRLAS